jgi:isopenicillin-N epimerase
MHFLNHGSFGATPRHVLAAQDAWRARLEQQPVRFMSTELPGALRGAANRLASFLGTTGDRLAFVENTTDAVNAVLRSFRWTTGDEIVIANHAYLGVRNAARYAADRYGLHVAEAVVPFPLKSAQDIADAYCTAITSKTRLAIIDHVFSPLALVTPLAGIIAHCKRLGVRVLVDGAHAPGMLPLALDAFDADWTTGNCHKWLFAPKACGYLHTAPDAAADLHPTVISNFHARGFPLEFDWQGTRDYSAWLAVTAALDFIQALGVKRYRDHLKTQIADAAHRLCESWQIELPAPLDACAAMLTVPLPVALQTGDTPEAQAARWHDELWREHRIEIPVLVINDRLWLRVSAQVYNDASDIAALADAIRSHRQ